MSVAIITDNIDIGSSGTIARQLFEYGKENDNNVVVYHSRGIKRKEEGVVKYEGIIEIVFHKLMTLMLGDQGCHSLLATNRLIKHMKHNNTESVIIITLHDYALNEKKLFEYFYDNDIKVAYVTIDQYAALGKCCYANECDRYITGCGECPQVSEYPKSLFFDRSQKIFAIKKNAYKRLNKIAFLGPEFNLELFRKSPLTENHRLETVDWGIDLEKYKNITDNQIYEKYKIPRDKIIMLCVAPYSVESKGVRKYYFEAAKSINNEKYHFVNIGYDGNLNVEDIPSNMTLIPYVKDQKELVKLYSISDLYILPSINDTMPLSCLIALACGVQVCCFYTSGLKYLAPTDSGCIKYAQRISTDSVIKEILSTGKKTAESMEMCRKYAEARYSSSLFNERVYSILESL